MPEPFIDLSNFNPLGTDVQSGFVEQGLLIGRIPPKVQGQRLRPLRVDSFQRRLEPAGQLGHDLRASVRRG